MSAENENAAKKEPYLNAPGWTAQVGDYVYAPGTVTATISNLAGAIEMLAYDAIFADTFPEGRRLRAIEAIAHCIKELSAPLPEILDQMSEQQG